MQLTAQLNVLPVCRGCGTQLPLDVGDAWLLCGACGRADSIVPDADVRLDLKFLAARGYDRKLAVPFFRFPRPALLAGELQPSQTVVDRLATLGNVWVIATPLRRFHGYGDVSYELTRRPPRLEPGTPVKLVGAGRTLADAERVAQLLTWRYLGDERPISDGTELEFGLALPELCAVPVQIDDGLLKFPHCPIRYPVAVIERLVY